MNILSLDGVSKTLLDAPLFEAVTLGIDDGERVLGLLHLGTARQEQRVPERPPVQDFVTWLP